jgi:hypothetical protein
MKAWSDPLEMGFFAIYPSDSSQSDLSSSVSGSLGRSWKLPLIYLSSGVFLDRISLDRIGRMGDLEISQSCNVLIGCEYRVWTRSRRGLRKMSFLKGLRCGGTLVRWLCQCSRTQSDIGIWISCMVVTAIVFLQIFDLFKVAVSKAGETRRKERVVLCLYVACTEENWEMGVFSESQYTHGPWICGRRAW